MALDYKLDARYLVKNALKYLDFGKSEIWVRINKEMAMEDLRDFLRHHSLADLLEVLEK